MERIDLSTNAVKIKAEMSENTIILTVNGSNMILSVAQAQEICKALHGELYV